VLKFSGALTLTHNGTTLALPGAANITTANGDYAAFQSRGGGNWYCMWYMRATGLPLVASGGALTNFTEAVSTATPNATVPVVSLVATNAATNADAAFMPKGTGALTARVADNGSTNGNKRGTSAVDWQRDLNGDATAVAAGTGSVIGGGLGNKVNSGSAQATIAGGYTNNVSGGSQGAIAGGRTNNVSSNYGAIGGGISNVASTSNYTTVGGGNSNTASGTAATVPGGDTNVADATSSIAMGANATTRTMMGSAAFSSTTALGLGKRQVKRAILTGSTTDAATAKILTVNNTTAGTTNQFCLPTGSTLRLRGVLAFRNSSGGDAGSVTVDGQVKNVSGTVSLSGTPVIGTYMGDSSLSTVAVTMTADNTNKCAAVTVNGVAATNIDHVAVFDALETTN
jgi:hypothetical protein